MNSAELRNFAVDLSHHLVAEKEVIDEAVASIVDTAKPAPGINVVVDFPITVHKREKSTRWPVRAQETPYFEIQVQKRPDRIGDLHPRRRI